MKISLQILITYKCYLFDLIIKTHVIFLINYIYSYKCRLVTKGQSVFSTEGYNFVIEIHNY